MARDVHVTHGVYRDRGAVVSLFFFRGARGALDRGESRGKGKQDVNRSRR